MLINVKMTRDLSQFSVFWVVTFCKVTANAGLVHAELLLLEEI